MPELSLNLGLNVSGVGTRLSDPASGYFSSNLQPNATITLIYGWSHPFNGPLSKSAHFSRPGPRWGGASLPPWIDLINTLFYECLTELKVKDKSNKAGKVL